MARIACLGSALQDIFLIDRDDFASEKEVGLYGRIMVGSKVDIDRVSYEVGGGGTNAAVAFARHGHETIFLGNIGRDIASEAITSCFDREGIDSSYISVNPRKATGCSVILLDMRSGERTILTHRGASASFNNIDDAVLTSINPDWLYVTSVRGDMDTLLRFFERAKELGVKIMFNPGVLELKEHKKLIGLLEDVDILLVNKREAAQIVPGEILSELLSRLLNYVPSAIITDGAMGGIATYRPESGEGESYRFGIFEDVKVKDTTGAGDAFGSGFLAHLAAGKSFRQSLIFASANSTSVVKQLGAKRGILTGKESLHPMPIQKI